MTPKQKRKQDKQLAERCVAGSRVAWETIVIRHQVSVRFAIIRTLEGYGVYAPSHLVEDLESQVFFKLAANGFSRLQAYRGQASIKSWLQVMSVNLTRDHLRTRKKTTNVDQLLSLPDQSRGIEAELEAKETIAQLRSLWKELSEEDQKFVDAFFVQEMSFSDIAEKTGATLGALYARKNRIRKKIIMLAKTHGLMTG